MRKKKVYIPPMTEVIKVQNEGSLLKESDWGLNGGPTTPIQEGNPTKPGVHFAKEHNSVWDDEFEDAKNDINSAW